MSRTYKLSEILKRMQNIYDYYLDLDDMDNDKKQEYLDAFGYVMSIIDGDFHFYGDSEVTVE